MCEINCSGGCPECDPLSHKRVPHKHADLIKAWADGAEIQWYSSFTETWETTKNPTWSHEGQYRIKPEPQPDVEVYAALRVSHKHRYTVIDVQSRNNWSINNKPSYTRKPQVKFVYDGETGELKRIEKI